jgi:hypothetical protein
VPSEVGSGQVAIVPTFKGFRRAVDAEAEGAAKSADRGFRRIFAKTGGDSGKAAGRGFKRAFESQSTGFAAKSSRELEQAVAKSARALSDARLKEQDAAGKVRLAEAQLAEARQRYASDSSQVIRAEERLAAATRQVQTAQERTEDSTQALRAAQGRLADSADDAGNKFVSSWRRANDRVVDVFKGSFLGTFAANLVSGFLSRLGSGIRNGLQAALDFGLGAIDIASDLNESVNAVQVAYGEVGAQILELGKTSARTFGLSTRDLNSYAVQFSAFSQTIAGNGGDIAGTFQSILGRATDFASVMNLEVAEALGLFQSGLAGETEPLRKYGIDLSAASVEAYAYAHGIGEAGKQLTEAEKTQARYGALLEQTNKVAGDFANTSDELANKQRIQAALWDNVQAKLGTAFLPVAQKVTDVIADQLLPALDTLIQENGPGIAAAFEQAIPAFQELADEILPKLPQILTSVAEALPTIMSALTTMGPPLIDLLDDLTVGAAQIQEFFGILGEKLEVGAQQWQSFFSATGEAFAIGAQQWGDFFAGVGAWWDETVADFQIGAEQIGAFFGSIGADFATGWAQISSFFQSVGAAFSNGGRQVGAFASTVGQRVNEAVAFVGSIPGRVGEVFANAGSWLVSSGRALIQGFIDGIKAMIGRVGDAVGGVVEWARGFFPNSPAKRGPLSGSGWTKLGESGEAVMEQWVSGFGRPDLTGRLSAAVAATSPRPNTVLAAAEVAHSATAPVYVQNPWTGEYLLAKVDERAEEKVAAKATRSYTRLSSGVVSK